MPEPRTHHFPNSTILACIDIDRPGQAEAMQRHGADIVVSDIAEQEGRR